MYTYIHSLHRSMSLFHYMTHTHMYVYGIHIACHCASEFLAVISSAICGLQGQVRPMHLQNCRQILVLNCCDRIQPALPGAALSKFPIQTADMKSSLCEMRKVCGMRWGCTHHTDSHSTYFIWRVR